MQLQRWTRVVGLLLVFGSGAAACGSRERGGPPAPEGSGSITVFAAASLTDAFTEIGDAFTVANPRARVTFTFAGSSALVSQIVQGAPADVFASADETNMEKLADAGHQGSTPVLFATNRLEIAVAPGNPKRISGLADLAEPGVVLVLCAEQVPCGRLAKESLAKAGVSVTPRSFEENVRAVLTKVELGEADAGIVYATDVHGAHKSVAGVPIPDRENVSSKLAITVTRDAARPAVARAFVAFVAGADGQAILGKYGFATP